MLILRTLMGQITHLMMIYVPFAIPYVTLDTLQMCKLEKTLNITSCQQIINWNTRARLAKICVNM